MTPLQRLFDPSSAFEHPLTAVIVIAGAAVIALGFILPLALRRFGVIGPELATEIRVRTRSWVVLGLLIGIAAVMGGAWWMLGLFVLAAFAYVEFARATGLFRDPAVAWVPLIGLAALAFACVDHWWEMFSAVVVLTPVLITAVALVEDQPQGYLQRVSLAVFGFALVIVGLAHWAWIANDADYRPIVLLGVVAVQLNDVFAFCCGKAFGRRKLCPVTSPGKTRAGAIGALVLTTLLVTAAGRLYLGADSFATHRVHVVVLGLLLSAAGQMGDLVLSSVKRDVGVKDMGVTIPGHGGLLDRFDSLLLAGPVLVYFLRYFRGLGYDQPEGWLSHPVHMWLLGGLP